MRTATRKRLIIATLMAVTLSAISALAQTTLHTVRLAQAVLADGKSLRQGRTTCD